MLLFLMLLPACGPFGGGGSATPVSSPVVEATASPDVVPAAAASPTAAGTPVASPDPAPDTQLVEGGLTEPRTLNPLFVADPISEQLSHLVFNGLVLVDPQSGEPRGDLAESWDVSDDGLIYTFHLRQGVTWQDGQPLTAADVAFTYARMMDDQVRSPRYARLVERVRGVTERDPATVEIVLAHRDASFLTTSATLGVVPEHVLGAILPHELATDPFGISSTVGTGPFTLQQWIRGDRLVFQRSERYFRGTPGVAHYVFKIAASNDELMTGLRDGTIDWAPLAGDAASADGVSVERLPSYDMVYVALQLDSSKSRLFLDARVRRALLLAIDRGALVADVWHGAAVTAAGTIPPASWTYAPGADGPGYDPDEARRLLDEAGWVAGPDGARVKDGVSLRFALLANGENPERRTLAERLVQGWRAVGVDARVDLQPASTVRQRGVRQRDFEALLLGYRWDVDPDASALWSGDAFFDAFNLGHYASAEVDQRLEAALASTDPAERRRLYGEIDAQIMADLPVLPLAFPDLVIGRSQRLQDARITAILVENRANIAEWNPGQGG